MFMLVCLVYKKAKYINLMEKSNCGKLKVCGFDDFFNGKGYISDDPPINMHVRLRIGPKILACNVIVITTGLSSISKVTAN